MAEEEKDKTPVDVYKKDDEIVSRMAARLKVPKADIMKKAIDVLAREPDVATKSKEKFIDLADALKEVSPNESKDPFDQMIRLMLVKEFAGKKGDSGELDLNKILAFSAIRSMMQPDPMLMMAMQKGQGDAGTNQMIQQMMQQQAQNNQMLMTMLFGKRMEGMETEIKEGQQETAQMLAATLGNIDTRMSQLSKQQKASLAEELEHYSTVRKAMIDFAEAEGMKKEEITTSEGKLNWQSIADRMLRIGEAVAKKMPAQTPSPKAITPMQEPSGAPIVLSARQQVTEVPVETGIPGAPPGLTTEEIAEATTEAAAPPKAEIE